MMLLAVTLILGFILLDFTLIGFIPSISKIWPSLNELKNEALIEDTTIFGSIKTNIEAKFVRSMINNMVGYKSILLTPECLVVKNTRLTYLLRIDIQSINSYTIKKQLIGKKIIIYLSVENKGKFFQFRTSKPDDWIEAFKEMGLKKNTLSANK